MIRLLPLLAGAAACAPLADLPPPSAPPVGSYRALGTEPFWAVTIADGRIRYERAGEPGFSVAAPPPRTSFNGHRYETSRLTVDVTHGQCSDGMSDRVYADTVTVMLDGETLRGCGGEILPPAELAGTSWSIVAIDGEPVPRTPTYFINFEERRLSGKAGCNGFGGTYEVSGRTLVPGPIAATRMACPGPAMAHEQRALAILRGPVQIEFRGGDTLLLRGREGMLTLRRSI
jgi:heat shock protein HslJ